MDRTWILIKNRRAKEYLVGVNSFIDVASTHLNEDNKCRCPCKSCVNLTYATLDDIRTHIMRFGFTESYDVWVCHGEKETTPSSFLDGIDRPNVNVEMDEGEEDDDNNIMGPILEDFARGAQREIEEDDPMDVNTVFGDSLEELYPGCKFTSLEAIIRLMHIKVLNHWSNKSFDMILKFIHLMWPNLNKFPESYYEAKKRLREVGLGYEKIDACKYDCALFWKENALAERCPVCHESRYKSNDGKGKKIPHKCLRYFPLTPRLQRLYLSRHTAKDMRWHKEKRDDASDQLRHPADGESWKEFDQTYPAFADDARNVRLGLAADGFTPFSSPTTASYSMWPVIVVPYNLPPWKCMKEPFRMMSLLIPGPQSPGKDIDVFLRPLIDELKELWTVGVETYDAASSKKFQMHASLLWTINDFPAYGNLSGWSTHGYKACPVCMDDTISQPITSKICYMGHRRLLPPRHRWRRSKDHDGKVELRPAPKIKTGEEILLELEHVKNVTFGKHKTNKDHKRKRTEFERNWTKKSIFFELPYWSKLRIRHCLDVMHIEKNICDNVLHTLLNTDGKTKDTIKSRIDLEKLNIRPDLHLRKLPNGKIVKPAASYVLTASDRTKFLDFISNVKFPDGYAANISRGVNVREGKIFGLKSHDSHVILQRLIPIGIRSFLPKDVCTTLIELSSFFQQLTSKTLCKSDLAKLDESIVMILCKLERIFPPAFFDVMIHLAVHLVEEVRLGGPVGPRWMFPVERDMGAYKKFVTNKAHPEGSIAEAYTVNEALTFCSMYIHNMETKFTRPDRNADQVESHATISVFSQKAKAFGRDSREDWSKTQLMKAHWTVLRNCDEILEYKNEHMALLELDDPDLLFERQQKEFPTWFEIHMKSLRRQGSVKATNELYALACTPDPTVHVYPNCIVNGVRFRTNVRDGSRKTQNSGVSVLGEYDEDEIDYYGYLSNVIVLDYMFNYKVVLFECEWYDTDPKKQRVKRDHHFISVNTTKKWFVEDPFILANQAKQVFYVDDLKLGKDWKVVQKVEQRQIWDVSEKEDIEADLDVALDAYQQDESVRYEWEVDPNDPVGELSRGETNFVDLTEEQVEILRQASESDDEQRLSMIDDDNSDEYFSEGENDLVSENDSD